MPLEPIDPATHDYAAEEARIDAYVERLLCNGGEPIIYFGNGEAPQGAIEPFSAQGQETPYRGVPLDSPELTVTFDRADWELIHEIVSAALEDAQANGLEHRRLEALDVLQENLSALIDPEHG